ncbi:hypothetical protein K440DRAFT_609597, partial [Wilcoxina mikolae CBS 423.85]
MDEDRIGRGSTKRDEMQFQNEMFMFSQWGGIWSSFLYKARPDPSSPPDANILSLQQREAQMLAFDRSSVTPTAVESLFRMNLSISQTLLGRIEPRFLCANVPDGEKITMETIDWLGDLLWVHLYPLGTDIQGRGVAYEYLGLGDSLQNLRTVMEMRGVSMRAGGL